MTIVVTLSNQLTETTNMNTHKVIALARKNVGANPTNESSARLCLEDAVNLYNKADFEHAKKRAIDSLRYSVGIFHADYKKASA